MSRLCLKPNNKKLFNEWYLYHDLAFKLGIMAQRFGTKKELLIWLGKNPDDRRLVDRLMLRGEVRMENWMYVYESKEEVILGLENRVKELEKEIENLKQERGNNDTQVVDKNDNSDLLDHLRYLYIRNEIRKDCINRLVQLYYTKNTAAWWEAAMEKAYQIIWFKDDPDEDAELEYIRSLL